MQINMSDSLINNVTQLKEFLKGSKRFDLSLEDSPIEEKYLFIDKTVDRFSYHKLKKKDKKVVINYLRKITGYKKAQLKRLILRAVDGDLKRKSYKRIRPKKIYTSSDIKLLEKTDEFHLRMSEGATKEILRREFEVFHHGNYETISGISHAHITNLRHSPVYNSHWVNGTKSRLVPIGITMPPENYGRPGSIRVDAVHQRDVYHINSVDEITQWEVAVCVPQISEEYLYHALQLLLKQYPFHIFNFHSDRGSEFINKIVARLLNKLLIHQTKSRSRHCNDNALVETKNGSVIRKNLGYFHINKGLTGEFNNFFENWFNPYLNYHRPCGFVTEVLVDFKGREKKVYGQYTTPYEKLKEISEEQDKNFLNPSLSFEDLDKIAYNMSDNDFAVLMRKQQNDLFDINSLLKSQ